MKVQDDQWCGYIGTWHHHIPVFHTDGHHTSVEPQQSKQDQPADFVQDLLQLYKEVMLSRRDE